jgi:xanthine dehydrogenase YagS FAD-binding subunit
MQTFSYERVLSVADAVGAAAASDKMFIAGGTELLNWMKDSIVAPRGLIDINSVSGLDHIAADERGLQLGALARMSDVAQHDIVRRDYPAISQALLRSASPQLRNMASMAGNLLQRTRCPYFRAEVELPCNKRRLGSGCAALEGEDRAMAVFGASDACIATHPSDVAVALAALDGVVHTQGPAGGRAIRLTDLYREPGDDPSRDTVLDPGELITTIEVPVSSAARRSYYLKVRERGSYEFALVSAAVAIGLNGSRIRDARIALGGVAHKPWRLSAAEQSLRGVEATDRPAVRRALDGAFVDAKARFHNGFKIELAKRTAMRALQIAAQTP